MCCSLSGEGDCIRLLSPNVGRPGSLSNTYSLLTARVVLVRFLHLRVQYTWHWSHAEQSGKIGPSPAGLPAPNALLDLTQTVLVSERAGACDWQRLLDKLRSRAMCWRPPHFQPTAQEHNTTGPDGEQAILCILVHVILEQRFGLFSILCNRLFAEKEAG